VNRIRFTPFIAALLAAAVISAGCDVQPAPSEDGVLWYLRNARLGAKHGRVRRVWDAGQQYIDAILKIDAQLAAQRRALQAWSTPLSLWPLDDPRWRDKPALAAHVKELGSLVEGAQFTRDQILHGLEDAVANVPDGLGLDTDDRRETFKRHVWDALKVDGQPLVDTLRTLEQTVTARYQLYRTVLDNHDDLTGDVGPVQFNDAIRQAGVETARADLMQSMTTQRESLIAYARAQLNEDTQRVGTLDKRKQRDEYDTIFNRTAYLREALRSLPKAFFNAAEKTAAKLEELEASPAPTTDERRARRDAQVAFLEHRLEWLKAEREQLRKQVDDILLSLN
jgi:hypothetical protein